MITAVVGVAGVVIGSVLTALLNFYLQRAADRRRWEREDEMQRQRWEREDRDALRVERISLYRDYVAQVHRAKDTALHWDEDVMRRMLYQIELLGSEEVKMWAVPLFFYTLDVWQESNRSAGPDSKIDEAMEVIDRTLLSFNKAVRDELGIPESPPKPRPRPLSERE